MDITRIRTKADYDEAYRQSVQDPEAFWAAQAETFTWRRKWDKVLEWDFHKPEVKWFIGGKRHIKRASGPDIQRTTKRASSKGESKISME
ncbi:MAG: hypothetical protein JST45_12060 [Bacteroidetes bacterium]|nr:hypothetical protein [Bacteroidota bacterium]